MVQYGVVVLGLGEESALWHVDSVYCWPVVGPSFSVADCWPVWHAGNNPLAGFYLPVSIGTYRVVDFQEGLQALRQFTLSHVKDRVEPSERDTLVLALFPILSLFFPFHEFPEDDREPMLA